MFQEGEKVRKTDENPSNRFQANLFKKQINTPLYFLIDTTVHYTKWHPKMNLPISLIASVLNRILLENIQM